MGRRSGFIGVLNAIARDAARAQRQAEAEQRRRIRAVAAAEREQERVQRQRARERAADEKEAKRQYVEDRIAETEQLTAELTERCDELAGVLAQTLRVDDRIAFGSLRLPETFNPFVPPAALQVPLSPPERPVVPDPTFLQRMIPGAQGRHLQALDDADNAYKAAMKQHAERLTRRLKELQELRQKHDAARDAYLAKARQRNEEVSELEESYAAGESNAVVTYNSMVLERSSYPPDFPQEFRVAYVAESKELVIEYELPGPAAVPEVEAYRYVKASDDIQGKPAKAVDRRRLYADVVAAVTLRTLHEVFEADLHGHIQVATFNGFIKAVDPATGSDVQPHLISIRVTRERFATIDLSRIEMQVCLKNLGASVSSRPDELQPVKPIVEFDMVDKRFVDQADVLSNIESRPNLMELNPFEFENLVSNLFGRMGLETKLTRSTKDGGVDAVAFDTRPVLGGKVVIQCKRYKSTVGVSAVRDLYGTMMNEGANKGILVSTSGYGPDAFDFSKDKPIELIDGGALLYLLDQVGVRARIVLPAV